MKGTMSKTKIPACRWKYDDSTCSWDTACDNKYQFTNDGPKENDYKFCPGCGGRVTLAGDFQSIAPETHAPKGGCAPVTLLDLLDSATRLNVIVEGVREKRWAFDGYRFKDTAEWCDFYVKLQRATSSGSNSYSPPSKDV
jgi:hypothetical protein